MPHIDERSESSTVMSVVITLDIVPWNGPGGSQSRIPLLGSASGQTRAKIQQKTSPTELNRDDDCPRPVYDGCALEHCETEA